MTTDKMVEMVVFTSRDGKNDWKPTKIEDLPEWLMDTEIMGRLAAGFDFHDPAFGAAWYRGIVVEPEETKIAQITRNLIVH